MRPWLLAETNYAYTKEHAYEVAVLPLGATEPHNLHLPYGTDTFEGTIIGEKVCEAAHARGAKVVLLPTIPYGTETNMREFPLAMNVDPSTLFTFVTDLVRSLETSGIRKVLLLNSHGGNDMKPLLRELAGKTSTHLFLCDWFRSILDVYDQIFEKRDDHAGESRVRHRGERMPAAGDVAAVVVRHADGDREPEAEKNGRHCVRLSRATTRRTDTATSARCRSRSRGSAVRA